MNLFLICSSGIFLSNVVANLYLKNYLYAFLFYLLTLTSFFQHGLNTTFTKRIDQFAILSVVSYGGYRFFTKSGNKFLRFTVYLFFLLTVLFYCYGKMVNQYCFHPNQREADLWHGLLHVLSSIGHHLIAFT